MATKRKYGYYIKGNKIAIIEEGQGSGVCSLSGYNTQSTCEDAGGTWTENASGVNDGEYRSPIQTIEDGLEIQYAYSPTFNLQSTGTEGTDFHKFIGWGSDGTNLLLFTYGSGGVKDISSLFAVDDYINIAGSGRWSGLHQVKSTGGTTGILTLKTKCNLKPSTISVTVDLTNNETLDGADTASDLDIEVFKDLISSYDSRTTPYVFLDASSAWELRDNAWEDVALEWDSANNDALGVFSVTYGSTSGQITLGNRITIDADGDYTSTAAVLLSASGVSCTIYNIFYEQISVYEGMEVLQDETFELDISRYQANAVVYYLKAKLAEDSLDMEAREYFLREFKRQLEKGNSALKRGPYIVQGFREMR
jgi:hypothetical protein